MRKLLAIWLAIFPVLAMASGNGALSFTPPASDYSVVFLGNIFGIVDGVLHGSGSQIMGTMFGVFNAAVLALGGIIIMYTLIVSTMNTAQSGQMMGEKWSSIWVPVRATVGLALLIPKASGYCLMQIFVMWIVVQGVGAADKVWEAALSYLNRGGSIIQAQTDPTAALVGAGAGSGVSNGAEVMLEGQVCMLGLQNVLQNRLDELKSMKGNNTPCTDKTSPIYTFCTSSVPDFINSVNVVDMQSRTLLNSLDGSSGSDKLLKVFMPNFEPGSPYAYLNGICGNIQWNTFRQADINTVKQNIPSVKGSDLDAVTQSRVVAIQQMYMDLSLVAQSMVSNDPQLSRRNASQSTSIQNDSDNNFSSAAVEQFGIPQTAGGTPCTNYSTPQCILWGTAVSSSSAPMLNGTEFPGAILDYNAIMKPTLTLVHEAQNAQSAQGARQFIQAANNNGWIMAGSYFFNLINLNVQASSGTDGLYDSKTGLENSQFNASNLAAAFSGNNICQSGPYQALCNWLDGNSKNITAIQSLIDGTSLDGSSVVQKPNLNSVGSLNVITGVASSTVNGYINNAMILKLPGQPGNAGPQLPGSININFNSPGFQLPTQNFPCGDMKFAFFHICVGEILGNIFWNMLVVNVWNILTAVVLPMIGTAIDMIIMIPIEGMSVIFRQGVGIISAPGVNPVVALAQMGTFYINFACQLYINMLLFTATSSLFPLFVPILAIAFMGMPIIVGWLSVMLTIGFTTSYYVPILPYMIFTFGSIGWLMSVIEAMVAAPIVALGITHPEGSETLGKSDQAVMILMNVFLRPAMMIIGYIAGIAMTYVSVWIINAGFDNAIGFINAGTQASSGSMSDGNGGTVSGGYTGWAGVFAYFFSVLIYTTMYLTVVQKAFTLISTLPDKVLRWVGGQQESYGQDTSQWGQEMQKKIEDTGSKSMDLVGSASKGAAGQLGIKGSSSSSSATKSGDMKGSEDSSSSASSGGGGAGGGGAGGGGAGGAGAGAGGAEGAATAVAETG